MNNGLHQFRSNGRNITTMGGAHRARYLAMKNRPEETKEADEEGKTTAEAHNSDRTDSVQKSADADRELYRLRAY